MAAKQDRAISIHQLLTKKRRELTLPPKWAASFGSPELGAVWFVWGGSGSGKTSFVLQLCAMLCSLGYRVLYNSMEEGDSKSFAEAVVREGVDKYRKRFIALDNEPIDVMGLRMKKHKSPEVAVIDSLQYSGMTYREYKAFKDAFRGKMLVIISHAEGKEPQGRTGKAVRYDSSVKIHVEGYRAFVVSRYGGNQPYTINDERAIEYWGE